MKFDAKKFITLNIPYLIVFYIVDKAAWLYRYCIGDSVINKLYALCLSIRKCIKRASKSA